MAIAGGLLYLGYRAYRGFQDSIPELPTIEFPALPELPDLVPILTLLPEVDLSGEPTPGISELGTSLQDTTTNKKTGKKNYHKPKPELPAGDASIEKMEIVSQTQGGLDNPIVPAGILEAAAIYTADVYRDTSYQGTAPAVPGRLLEVKPYDY